MRGLDIAVAGCGPAGLAAALLLARRGHRVTLYERFDAPQPVGSGLMLQPTGLAVLDRLGLAEEIAGLGAPVTRLLGRAVPSGAVVLDVRYDWLKVPSACGIAVHRAALFETLYQAVVRDGTVIETGRRVTGSDLDAGGRRLVFADGSRSPRHDLLVDASGSCSPLAPEAGRPLAYGALWATLKWPEEGFAGDRLEQRYRHASTMVGVLPIGRRPGVPHRLAAFFWSLRADRLEAWRAGGLELWKAEVRALWPQTAPLLDQIAEAAQLTFAHYSHRTLRRPAEEALIHIGDAWHSTSPQLGQGANMALLDAWALARGLEGAGDLASALARAAAMRRFHVRLYQSLSCLFTPAYQSDSRLLPFIRDRIVPPFGKLWPATRIQAAMVAGTFGGGLKPLGLNPWVPASAGAGA
ncbi:MAG TPA: NAD(P)/FAD-dependent oxidoreductase [Allosphingosinicella sp.]|jgi:2-polyprenyl-6-methoxyphenol hydroxylase-like FAD-dependent oxidoreductase